MYILNQKKMQNSRLIFLFQNRVSNYFSTKLKVNSPLEFFSLNKHRKKTCLALNCSRIPKLEPKKELIQGSYKITLYSSQLSYIILQVNPGLALNFNYGSTNMIVEYGILVCQWMQIHYWINSLPWMKSLLMDSFIHILLNIIHP